MVAGRVFGWSVGVLVRLGVWVLFLSTGLFVLRDGLDLCGGGVVWCL